MEANIEKSIDVYSLVTNRIIELLEQGTIPWQLPWTDRGIPRNLITKRAYRGINTLLLNALPFEHNLFLTWKQIKTVGGSVLKGEKGHYVVFNKMVEKPSVEGSTDKPEKQFFLRYYKVFNLSQTKNIPSEFIPKVTDAQEKITSCESIIDSMPNPPRIQFKGREAYYHPKEDYINLPPFKSFISTDAYYSVLFHELIHSTGNEQRLNRKEVAEKIVFGSEDYSLEELTAEIGACFLKSFSGIPGNDMSQNAAYIQNWLTVLRNDKRFILKASSRAQKATEYILNWDTSDSNSAKEIEEQEFEIPEEF